MAREPAAIRYKNPGAMWPGKTATKWGSTKWVYLNDGTGQGGGGKGNKIAIFDTWVQGICAQLDLWRTSPNYRNKRFADAIRVWSGGNNVPSYIAYVKARIPGMNENTIMNDEFWRGPLGLQFLRVQAGHEAGKAIPAPAEDWAKAQSIVMSDKAPMTAPVKKTVATSTASTVTTAATANEAVQSGWPWWAVVLVVAAGIAIPIVAAWFFNRQKVIYEAEPSEPILTRGD